MDTDRLASLRDVYRDGRPLRRRRYVHTEGFAAIGLAALGRANLWKGPFHIPRIQLVCWKSLEEQLS